MSATSEKRPMKRAFCGWPEARMVEVVGVRCMHIGGGGRWRERTGLRVARGEDGERAADDTEHDAREIEQQRQVARAHAGGQLHAAGDPDVRGARSCVRVRVRGRVRVRVGVRRPRRARRALRGGRRAALSGH